MNNPMQDLKPLDIVILGLMADKSASEIQTVLHKMGCMVPLDVLQEIMDEILESAKEDPIVVELHVTQVVLH